MKRKELAKYAIPDAPGIYMFLGPPSHTSSASAKGLADRSAGRGRQILYIGKAASLRDRVRSYFSKDLAEARSPAVLGMVEKATSLSWRVTGSVLEALILEANLIKKHQPPFNVDLKDNKSWNYVVITKEDFPRVLLVRGRELFGLKADIWKLKAIYGPYPHGGQLKEALKIIRRIFPYRDSKCIPCADQLNGKLLSNSHELDNKKCKPCFNRQIGLCPGVCSGDVRKGEYRNTIAHIRQLLGGNFKGLKRELIQEMKAAAKQEEFEIASRLRRQIDALEHIRDVSLIKREGRVSMGGPSTSLRAIRRTRIEAFDVAHTAGSETVAVMAVIENGEPERSAYRKFRIRTAKNDDVAALTEAWARRLGHPEWPLPRVFAVDGGRAQGRAVERILEQVGLAIPVVGETSGTQI